MYWEEKKKGSYSDRIPHNFIFKWQFCILDIS